MTSIIFCDYCNESIQYWGDGCEITIHSLDKEDYLPTSVPYGEYHIHKKCLGKLVDLIEESKHELGN